MSTASDLATTLPEHDLLTVAEVAAWMRVTETYVRDQCRAGVLPAVRRGRLWRVPRATLLRQLAEEAEGAQRRQARRRRTGS